MPAVAQPAVAQVVFVTKSLCWICWLLLLKPLDLARAGQAKRANAVSGDLQKRRRGIP